MSLTIKNIEMTLEPASIERAIRQIQDVQNRLGPAMICLINALAEKGVDIARAELIFFSKPAYDTGALSESMQYIPYDGNAAYVKTDIHYAAFVEYGTGVVGEASPHPEPSQWAYDSHGHGEAGWWYPSPYGWVQASGDGPMLAWTRGMASRPFTYNTLRDLEEEAEANGGKIVAEYLRGERA